MYPVATHPIPNFTSTLTISYLTFPQSNLGLERHRELYGQVPRQSAWDGGFASAANLSWAKEQGVEDVAFAKKCGLTVESMVRSSWVYKELKRFRAGIEGCIGTLKHTFGLDRCTWKGWPHFQSYVHASVLTYNLVVLARLLL